MFGGMDPKKMQAMMKKMGIKTEEIQADEVTIKGEKELVIKNPKVTMMEVQGQKTFQVVGEVEERTGAAVEVTAFSAQDIKMVAEQAGVSEEEAEKALLETKDIAEAILKLKKD